MSFILDALRKSDQMRQANVTPTLPPLQPATPSHRRPSLPVAAVAGGILLGVGLLLGWLQPWAPTAQPLAPAPIAEAPRPAPQSMSSSTPSSEPRTAALAANATTPGVAPLPAPALPPEPASRNEARATPATARPAPAAPAVPQATPPAAPKMPVAAAPGTAASPPAPTQEAAAEPPPLALDDLPPNILAELPRISVTAHSYSKKAKAGFAFVNDRMLHENESLAPGLKLERITVDGMIFSYKGYRFRRGLQP